ncbi:MAG: hypothetical protein U0X39_12605 [Bacteroidales bacterium]
MKSKLLLFVLLPLFLTGCFAPVNLTYDSAKTLKKGQVEVQGAYSRYSISNDSLKSALINQNYGLSLGYGVSDRYTVKFRYEYISPTVTFQKVFGDISDDFNAMNSLSYFEINSKLALSKDKLAISLPLGGYFYNTSGLSNSTGGLGWFSFDPRLYLTFFNTSKNFDLTISPKAHVLFGSFGGYALLGVSVGAGISSDLSKWAIRPEIGYDRYFSFGVGASIYFDTRGGKE